MNGFSRTIERSQAHSHETYPNNNIYNKLIKYFLGCGSSTDLIGSLLDPFQKLSHLNEDIIYITYETINFVLLSRKRKTSMTKPILVPTLAN